MEGHRVPTAVVSYAHAASALDETISALADRLRADGIDCKLEQNASPPQGWVAWMDEQLNVVFAVTTERPSTNQRPI